MSETFHFVMIKPTRYDDDGYPILWLRTLIPSNTLAALYGLAADCVRRGILGPDVDIRLHAFDETNCRIRPERIIRDLQQAGGRVLIGFVGVQSNQFPRAVDLAQPFLRAGMQVAIGGFHVSGCRSMLAEWPPEIRAAMEQGVTMFAGECEGQRLDEILRDAQRGELKPFYNHLDDLPNLEDEPPPLLPRGMLSRNYDLISSFDLGRGCPFQCSFCTIINVQGRKSRFRTADDLERIVRENAAAGIRFFFITDDNLARNKRWEEFFDRLILLREKEGLRVSLIIQVDALCHRTPGFIDKASHAGVSRVYIGLENINPDNLLEAKKRQNKITEYRYMLQQWRKHGIFTWAGYILGFPGDTRESILRDIEIIKRELPLDILEFFYRTPLPGSEDHKVLADKGGWMDADLNKYDLHHRVTHHPKMSDAEWEEVNRLCWEHYYTPEHLETVCRRHAAKSDALALRIVKYLAEFKIMYKAEGIHPLEGGIVRLRYRRDRRPGLPRESWLPFHLKNLGLLAFKAYHYGAISLSSWLIVRRVCKDPARHAYVDIATTPADAEEFDALEMYQQTAGARRAVEKKRQDERRSHATAR